MTLERQKEELDLVRLMEKMMVDLRVELGMEVLQAVISQELKQQEQRAASQREVRVLVLVLVVVVVVVLLLLLAVPVVMVHIVGEAVKMVWEVLEEVCRMVEHGKRPGKCPMEQYLLKKTNY